MNILVACETSGKVRDAFNRRGHSAVSVDTQPTKTPGPHIQADIRDVLGSAGHWDMLLAFPPCTHLAVSGARWFEDKRADGRQQEAVALFLRLVTADIPRVAIENPVGIMSTQYRKPDQIIQPWQYGHGETKATCLWLKGLPPLQPTDVVEGREARIHKMPPSPDRGDLRSETYDGVAEAMADQWGTRALDLQGALL